MAASTASATVSSVSLEKAYTTCDVETGQVEIIWPENAEIFKASSRKPYLPQALRNMFIRSVTVLDHNSLLDVQFMFKLTMDSELFVAKKFFEIGSDDSVTADENAEFLKCELIRLKTATWFLKKFKAAAKEMKVDIATSKWFFLTQI